MCIWVTVTKAVTVVLVFSGSMKVLIVVLGDTIDTIDSIDTQRVSIYKWVTIGSIAYKYILYT